MCEFIYTLSREQVDTLVKRVLDKWWPIDEMGSWLRYISDQDIDDWLGDDVAGIKKQEALNVQ